MKDAITIGPKKKPSVHKGDLEILRDSLESGLLVFRRVCLDSLKNLQLDSKLDGLPAKTDTARRDKGEAEDPTDAVFQICL